MGLREEGLRAFGAWEPLMHRLRTSPEGTHRITEAYAWEHTEEFIKGLKDRGFNLFITHFSKGYGIEAEAEERENTRRIVQLCHQHGIYAGGYIRYTTFIPETLAREVPDCIERFGALNSKGAYTRYNRQYWRYIPCPSSRQWLEYLDRLIGIAVGEIGLDCLHFDGLTLRAEPYACHCQRCCDRFRQWLRRRYPTPESQQERFGFTGLDYVAPPDFAVAAFEWTPLPVITEPVAQEWMWFRCSLLADGWKFVVDAARRRNPDVVIQGNSAFAPDRNNTWFAGVHLGDLVSAGSDGFFHEGGVSARLLPDHRLEGYFETFKKLRSLGVQTFTYNRNPGPDYGPITQPEQLKLSMAHQLAFNLDASGVFCHERAPGEWPFTVPEYMAFHRDRRDLFRDAALAPDVALYCSERTCALNCGTPLATHLIAFAALLRAHVPFSYVLDSRTAEIKPYRAVILPETECMTEAEAENIAAYVKAGGGLLVIGANTGAYDEFRRRRHTPPLTAALGIEWSDASPTFAARVGAGRVAFLPTLVTPQGTPASLVRDAVAKSNRAFWHLELHQWQPALNAVDLLHLLRWAAGGFRYELLLPDTVVAEFTRRAAPDREMIHLVNFDVEREVGPFEVKCRAKLVSTAEAFTPDGPPPDVHVDRHDADASSIIRVGGFHRYLVLSLS